MKSRILAALSLLLILITLPHTHAQDLSDNVKKISNVNLLLPLIYDNIENRNIQHILVGYNGCYEWRTTQPSVLKVTGVPDEKNSQCNTNAVVSLATQKTFNNIIWISAHDRGRLLLRC